MNTFVEEIQNVIYTIMTNHWLKQFNVDHVGGVRIAYLVFFLLFVCFRPIPNAASISVLSILIALLVFSNVYLETRKLIRILEFLIALLPLQFSSSE